MNTQHETPKTLMEAVRYFADPDIAQSFFVQIRWPNGVCCPTCGSVKVSYLANQRRWQCSSRHPKRQFSAKVGTIFEDSALGLDKWLVAFWLETSAKNSISSYEVARHLGITQKSAWFMLHRIRTSLKNGSLEKLSGTIEADETFLGGKLQNMHKKRADRVRRNRKDHGKAAVFGMLQRGGEVRTMVLPAVDNANIHPQIRTNVEPGSNLFTDNWGGYRGLSTEYFHRFVDHSFEYVRGNVHTNSLENFWALFKRCVKGTHVTIEPFHLFRYLDAECFRFNNRKTDDGGRFMKALPGVIGKRLTYRNLIGGDSLVPIS